MSRLYASNQRGFIHLFTILLLVLVGATLWMIASWNQRQNKLEAELNSVQKKEELLELKVQTLELAQMGNQKAQK